MHDNDLQEHLQRLFDDPAFGVLRARFDAFDPFKVLKVERFELRHTTTLSWLLDPQQNHGLGDSFLRLFLDRTCGDAAGQHPLLADGQTLAGRVAVQAELRLSGGKLRAQVTAEDDDAEAAARRNGELDVLIESETVAVAIEAKIDSKEGLAQLSDYSRYLASRFDGNKRLYRLYLTVDPDDDVIEKNPEWTGIQWGLHVADALGAALSARYGPDPVQALASCVADERARCEFLYRYLHLLQGLGNALHGIADEARTLADNHYATLAALKKGLQEQETLGAPILPWSTSPRWAQAYWDNRHVIDVLIERMRSPEAGFADEIVQYLFSKSPSPMSLLTRSGSNRATIRFVPEDWKAWQVGKDQRPVPLSSLMFYHVAFRGAKGDIEIKLYLPKTRLKDLQLQLVEQMLGHQATLGSAALQPDADALRAFVAPTGSSMKLYRVMLPWTRSGAGLSLNDGAEEGMRAFWQAVDEHTALLRAVLSD